VTNFKLSERDAAAVEAFNDAEIATASGENVVRLHLHAVDDDSDDDGADDDAVTEDWRAVVERLAVLPPIECEQQLKHGADLLGVPTATLRTEVKKERNRTGSKPPSEQSAVEHVDIGALEMSAAAIIDSDDVLALFEKVWSRVMAGERRNARLLYLMATTRLFDKCMSGAIKGPSSAGKSELRQRVLDFMPPEHVVAFSTLSEKALLYIDGDFCHKILSMGEAAGTEEQSLQDYLLRELISSGKLVYPVVQKVGNEMMTVVIEKNGPVCFFVTTTKAALHPENETRLMSIEVDDSGEQTALVIGKVAEAIGLNAEKAVIDYGPWQNFQRWLAAGNCSVVVPFARELGKLVPPRSVRLRRDFSQILLAIKAHALIHRNHRQVDDRGHIVADLDLDYLPVAELIGGIVAEASGTRIASEVQETINAVRISTTNRAPDDGATAFEVARLLKLDKSSAWRRLNVARDKGYVVNLEVRRGQPGRYRVTEQEVEAEALLPAPEAIAAHALLGAAQPAQPRNRRPKAEPRQKDSGCVSGCTTGCIATTDNQSATNCGDATGHATGHATGYPYEKHEEIATGCAVARVARGVRPIDPRQIDLEESIAEALASKPVDPHADYPDIPEGLDRRAKRVCQACDGIGCPTCQPRRFGIGG
jgi:hypothetical protein